MGKLIRRTGVPSLLWGGSFFDRCFFSKPHRNTFPPPPHIPKPDFSSVFSVPLGLSYLPGRTYLVLTCLTVSFYLVLACLILSCLTLSCRVIPRLVLPCHILSCRVISCLAVSYPVLACLDVSYLAFPSLLLPFARPFLLTTCAVLLDGWILANHTYVRVCVYMHLYA